MVAPVLCGKDAFTVVGNLELFPLQLRHNFAVGNELGVAFLCTADIVCNCSWSVCSYPCCCLH